MDGSQQKEEKVQKLWTEVALGVYQCQFIDPSKIYLIRKYLDEAHEAKIPTRPPHGITLNARSTLGGLPRHNRIAEVVLRFDGCIYATSRASLLSRLYIR